RGHRPALDPDGPRRSVGGERRQAIAAPVADQQNARPPQVGGIVEHARVPEPDGRMQPDLGPDPLSLSERRDVAVDRELYPAARLLAIRAVLICLHVEKETGAPSFPTDGLLEQPALDGDEG